MPKYPGLVAFCLLGEWSWHSGKTRETKETRETRKTRETREKWNLVRKKPWNYLIIREGLKNIESVIMIIPCRTPPTPLFFENCDHLRLFFLRCFLIIWIIQVCLETHFWFVWNKLCLWKAFKKHWICDHYHTLLE